MIAAPLVALALAAAPEDDALALALEPLVAHVESKIDVGAIPGAVVAVGDSSGTRFIRALGATKKKGAKGGRAMTTDTIFDLASVTKVVAGGSALAVAIADGALDVGHPASRYVPGIDDRITIDMLARHRSGLPPIVDVRPLARGDTVALWRTVSAAKLRHDPDADDTYSDVGVLTLGRAVELAEHRSLDALLISSVFSRLGMTDTGWVVGPGYRARLAPTRPTAVLGGVVHDPIARIALVAPVARDPAPLRAKATAPAHAGLFSTAPDLARWCAALLRGGDGVLDDDEVDRMLTASGRYNGYGFLSWGAPGGSDAVGKTGFTGTFVFLSRPRDVFLVYLSNRTAAVDDDDVSAPDFDGAVRAMWPALPVLHPK